MLLLHGLDDRLDEQRLVDHIGDFRDDDGRLAAFALFDVRLSANDELAPAGAGRIHDPLAAENDAARREIGSGKAREDLPEIGVVRIDQIAERVRDFPEVVRGHVRRHADGDSGASVHEKVRNRGREVHGLLQGLVEVRRPFDRVLLDVRKHELSMLVEARFRIPHRRRGIAVDGAEVALSVNERVAHAEVLRQTRHRIVD